MAVSLSRVSMQQGYTRTWLTILDTRLLWEDVLDTKNDYKFPVQYSNLTKVRCLNRHWKPLY